MIEIISTSKAPQPIGSYSQGIRSGNLIFLSGQLPIDPATDTIPANDIVSQTKQVMRNIEVTLKEAKSGFDQVVKTTIFLQNITQASTVNKIYESFFEDFHPARSTVQVARLPKDALVEIEVIAMCRS